MITSIKIKGNGYLVDGTMSVPKVNGNRHYEEIKLAIAGGNEDYPTAITVEDEFTQSELDTQTQNVINQEAIQYLLDTDWLLLRELDGGTVMSEEIKTLRAEARLAVIKL